MKLHFLRISVLVDVQMLQKLVFGTISTFATTLLLQLRILNQDIGDPYNSLFAIMQSYCPSNCPFIGSKMDFSYVVDHEHGPMAHVDQQKCYPFPKFSPYTHPHPKTLCITHALCKYWYIGKTAHILTMPPSAMPTFTRLEISYHIVTQYYFRLGISFYLAKSLASIITKPHTNFQNILTCSTRENMKKCNKVPIHGTPIAFCMSTL